MEWVLLFAIVCGFSDLSRQIKNLSNDNIKKQVMDKKRFPSLKELVDKTLEIEIEDNYYSYETKGILKFYDDVWIAIECINKSGKKEINYFRISNISSIDIIND